MPYIPQSRRFDIDHDQREITNAGELNYAISSMINRYMGRRALSYRMLNEVIGVLECAKMELYRRMAAPYEDGKMTSNGDVYTIPKGEDQ